MVLAETKHSLYGPCLLLNSTGRACSLQVSQGGRADSVRRTALALGRRWASVPGPACGTPGPPPHVVSVPGLSCPLWAFVFLLVCGWIFPLLLATNWRELLGPMVTLFNLLRKCPSVLQSVLSMTHPPPPHGRVRAGYHPQHSWRSAYVLWSAHCEFSNCIPRAPVQTPEKALLLVPRQQRPASLFLSLGFFPSSGLDVLRPRPVYFIQKLGRQGRGVWALLLLAGEYFLHWFCAGVDSSLAEI